LHAACIHIGNDAVGGVARYSPPRIGAARSITFAATGAAFEAAIHNVSGFCVDGRRCAWAGLADASLNTTQPPLAGWVEPFAKPIAFMDENRWVSLRSTHPTLRVGSSGPRY